MGMEIADKANKNWGDTKFIIYEIRIFTNVRIGGLFFGKIIRNETKLKDC